MVGIYKITNLINKKNYIGQSINIETRWKAHRSRPFQKNCSQYNSPLYRAIRKYGLKNFSFEVIEECLKEELNDKEIYYIKKYNSNDLNFGYNLTAGGNNTSNNKLSSQDILLIYKLLFSTTKTEEQIAKDFNVSQRTISGINLGEYYVQTGFSYPIRKKSKSKAKINFCKKCNAEISNSATYCVNCAHILSRIVERPSREQLKDEIRKESFTFLSKKYKVSDTSIKKWCKSYGLPYKKSDIKQINNKDWSKI